MILRHQQERAGKENYWRPKLEAWKASKMPVKAFCATNNLSPSQFKYWQYQLMPESKRGFNRKQTKPLSFIEVTRNNTVTQQQASESKMHINSDFGFSIELDVSVNSAQLKMILSSIKALA